MSIEPDAPGVPPIEPVLVVTPDERLWGMLAHLCGLLGYLVGLGQIVGPLIIYICYKDRSLFVAFHALQSLYFQLLVLVAIVASVLIAFASCGILVFLVGVVPLGSLIYVIYAAIQTYDGKMFEYWLAGTWARRHLGI